jgi:hypothetical protein
VEVAVGLGGKAGLNDGVAIFFGTHVLGDDVAEEVGGGSGLSCSDWAFRIRVGHGCDLLFHGRGVLNKSGVEGNKFARPGGQISIIRQDWMTILSPAVLEKG